jgi:hypothetical protein
MKKLLFLLILMFPTGVFAEPLEWSKTDAVLLTTSLATMSMDWASTNWASHHWCNTNLRYGPQGCVDIGSEGNPLLGKYPTTKEVNRHFIIAALGTITVAEFMPSHAYRDTFLLTFSLSEGYIAYHNTHNISVNWVMKY